MTLPQPETLALVVARGGSKGVPRKNIAPVGGKPLIAWTIAAALGSGFIDRLILSTDDQEIADVALSHGCEVPFLRPSELARDESSGFDVCEHALRWIEANGGGLPDYLLVLQPTSPLRTTADIDDAMRLIIARRAPALIGVCAAAPHPYIARRMLADGTLVDFHDFGEAPVRRQDYPPACCINGAIYIVTPETLLNLRTFQPPGTLAFMMPPERSLDIDTSWDLRVADLILSNH
jgi:CMP-N,N'-diacetyllegionaminic acid synthase